MPAGRQSLCLSPANQRQLFEPQAVAGDRTSHVTAHTARFGVVAPAAFSGAKQTPTPAPVHAAPAEEQYGRHALPWQVRPWPHWFVVVQ